MTNTNILPFGQAQEMPAGYPIADNLSTNSAQQALSARQGKELGDYLFGTTDVAVDLSTLTKKTGLIIAPDNTQFSNTFQNNANFECVLLPCQSGENYRLTAKSSVNFHYAVLTNNSLVVNQTPSYATGYSEKITVTAGSAVTIEIPSGGKYLYILVTNNNVDGTPTVVRIEDAAGMNTKIAEVAGREASKAQGKFAIFIAAADAPDWQKAKADYVCDGQHDEVVIQRAIDSLSGTGGRIILSLGNFNIDAFPKTRSGSYSHCAILLPQDRNEYYIEGTVFSLSRSGSGTIINVTGDCYDNLSSSGGYCVIGAATPSTPTQPNAIVSLHLENIRINLACNQKKIMCVDCYLISRVYLQFITCEAHIPSYVAEHYDGAAWNNDTPNPIAAEGCVGIRSVGGSNWGICCDFKNIFVCEFHTGFMLSGEHVVGINLAASRCYRGFSFNGFNSPSPCGHPMTLINCCDEQSNCGPYFGRWSIVQEIDLIGWNEERGGSEYPYDPNDETESVTKKGHRWKNATEAYKTDNSGNYVDKDGNITTDPTQYVPRNASHGRIDYTVYTSAGINSEAELFWEPGFGYGTISKNMAHKLSYPSTTLTNSGFKCDYMERFWVTDLNKEVICISTNPKTIVDLNGNPI